MRPRPSRPTRTATALLERAKHEADEIVAKAKTDAEALIERRTRMAEDKIAAEERAAVEQLRAAAADAAAKAAARLIAERHDAGDRRQARRSGDQGNRRAAKPLLLVLAAGLADAFERLLRAVSLSVFAAEVAEADDAAQPFLLVDHRQAADLRLAHPARDFLDILVDRARR